MEKIKTPIDTKQLQRLKVGDCCLLSGVIFTARDQAHKRLVEAIKKGGRLPFDFKGQIIYYCGPTKTPQGKVIGSAGPTTSSRMDEYAIPLLAKGLKGTIGKGSRAKKVAEAIKKYKAVYFLTFAGCAALLSKFVKKAKPIAYRELGPEAIYRLEVKDFPLIVGIDSLGESIYPDAPTEP